MHELHAFEERGRVFERDVSRRGQIDVVALAAADAFLFIVHRPGVAGSLPRLSLFHEPFTPRISPRNDESLPYKAKRGARGHEHRTSGAGARSTVDWRTMGSQPESAARRGRTAPRRMALRT